MEGRGDDGEGAALDGARSSTQEHERRAGPAAAPHGHAEDVVPPSNASTMSLTHRDGPVGVDGPPAGVDARATFRTEVKAHFETLVGSFGFEPNDAAALALKLAANMAEWPLDLTWFLAACGEASGSGDAKERREKRQAVLDAIERVFCSADALNSSFVARGGDGLSGAADAATAGGDPSATGLEPTASGSRGAPSESIGGLGGGDAETGAGGAQNATTTRRVQDALKLDFAGLRRCYEAVGTLGRDATAALVNALGRLLDALDAAHAWQAAGPALLRQILLVLECPALMDPEHSRVLGRLLTVAASLPSSAQHALVLSFRTYEREQFRRAVTLVQQFITVRLYDAQRIDEGVEAATKFLGVLYEANASGGGYVGAGAGIGPGGVNNSVSGGSGGERGGGGTDEDLFLPYTDFYNDAVNCDDFNIKEDYRRWKQPERYDFSFCKYPFVYDPASKARILQLESTMLMSHEFEDAVLRSIFIGATSPYLILKVRREYLIEDTLMEIQQHPEDLRKPLKVQFVGEEGVDEGGVQKEFFQLLIRQVFDPSFGMFTYNDETRSFWFSASSMLGLEMEYELIGMLVGLAIYNGHILEFRFPMLIYRKLMGYQPTMCDLREVNPWVHSGFAQLLDATPADVEAYGLTFQASQEVFGEIQTVDLVPGGSDRPVTAANRREYVELYVEWYLTSSIQSQFGAFQRGFNRLCGGPVVGLFRPEELEQLVCGSPTLDFEALESATVYEDGYVADSETVKAFWRVVHAMTEEQKKRLLFFTTGSDRVPIKGLGNLPFVISKNGTDDHRLPTAHTCFNHLLIPEYSDEGTLRERLITAIDNAEGFGLQ